MLFESRRLLSSALAICLGVAFVTTSLLLGDALTSTMRASAAGPIGDAAVIVTPSENLISPEDVTRIAQLPDVDSVRAIAIDGFVARNEGPSTYYTLQNNPPLTESTRLVEGRLPQAAGEAAATTSVARAQSLTIGSTLKPDDPDLPPQTIVGILETGADASQWRSGSLLFVPDETITHHLGGYGEAYVHSSTPVEELMNEILALDTTTGAFDVVDARAAIEERVAELAGGTTVMVTLLLAFATIALFTAALVIGNTFNILIAQRARQLALLRCVGATRGQVFRSVIGEAVGVALIASGMGVLLGLGLAWGAILLSQGTEIALSTLTPSPWSFITPMIVGVAVTVIAALIPARRATRISPLAALRTTAVTDAERPHALQIVSGAVLLAVGAAALIASGTAESLRPSAESVDLVSPALMVGLAGGLTSFIGVLLLSSVIVPATARLAAPLVRAWGVAGDLATENAVRTPKRAAAAASALLVGVTLITMMSVGASSAEASTMARLDGRFPVDAVVVGDLGTGSQAADVARTVEGVAQVAVVGSGYVTLGGSDSAAGMEVYSLADADHAVARSSTFADGLTDDTMVVPRSSEIPTGTQMEVTGDGGTVTLTAHMAERSGTPPLVTPAILDELAPGHPIELWVRFADNTDALATIDALGKAVSKDAPGVEVMGAATERAALKGVLDTVLAVVVGLLGVAVLIALVGISNTLSLSVLERTHESGLLRALGLSKRQLRRSVGLEAVLLAGVATVLGLALGIVYGAAGTATVLPPGTVIIMTVPWGRLAIVAVAAVAAGWLASVLPSIRAARVSPATALAEE